MFLFGFRKFIAPTVIKFLYYIGLTVTILGGLGVIIFALKEMQSLGGHQATRMILASVIGMPIIVLVLRFTTEMWLVLFEMNERLAEIRDK